MLEERSIVKELKGEMRKDKRIMDEQVDKEDEEKEESMWRQYKRYG